jgi:hypothetical protein
MSDSTITAQTAIQVEQEAFALGKRGDHAFVMSAALLASALRNADIEDIEELADGDEDAYAAFVDRNELGNFVFEHTLDTFEQIATLELQERTESAVNAWDVEVGLRQAQGAL